jgi:hypothetical protein
MSPLRLQEQPGANDQRNNRTPTMKPHKVIGAAATHILQEDGNAIITRKGKNVKGAFDRLKAGLRAYEREQKHAEMAKALVKMAPTSEVTACKPEFMDQAALMAKPKAIPVTKTKSATLAKSVDSTMARAAANLGVKAAASTSILKTLNNARSILKSMGFEAPTGASLVDDGSSDSADLTGGSALRNPSLARSRVYSDNELLKAGECALRDGKITVGEAYHLSSAVNIGKHPGNDAIAKLLDYLPKDDQ